jgi:hypothetical protein
VLIVAGHLIVEEEDRDRYVADCAAAVAEARQTERGTSQYPPIRLTRAA